MKQNYVTLDLLRNKFFNIILRIKILIKNGFIITFGTSVCFREIVL